MFKVLLKLLGGIGKLVEKSTDTYTPKHEGRWRERGHENWVWVEPTTLKPYIVNVFELEGDYIITVSFKVKKNAIESMDCRDKRELDIAIELLKVYYGTLGNVIISTEVE